MEGQPLSDQQIRDEVMTILLAGHESTANAMTWMWYLLAQHPPVETSLAQELSLILDCKPLTAETLRQLTYTGMVVNEALRLYPPAWALPREATENVIIGDYVIGKGSLLFGVPYIIHRDPRYYKDPESFVPERFANAREMPRHTYLPFGGGPRYCIGNNFALVAMQIALAAIHQHFRLQIIEEQEIVLDPLLTLRPRFGLHMRLVSHR
jgi:cytochrome P450